MLRLRQVVRKRDADDRLIPLINVVFLMLIFFLLAGTIRPPEPFEIALPQSSSEQDRPEKTLVLMLSADGTMALDSAIMQPDRIDLLNEKLSILWPKDTPDQTTQLRKVEIQADKMLPLALLSKVLAALSDAGADEISLITRH